jgi:hypothetical protein
MQDLTLLLYCNLQQIKKSGGPVIRSFVHSETQDGKSLLDAHFAHATALIKRFLKRVRQNLLNKVTSPAELAEALADQGGLKNCGVQLIIFDLDSCAPKPGLAEYDTANSSARSILVHTGTSCGNCLMREKTTTHGR